MIKCPFCGKEFERCEWCGKELKPEEFTWYETEERTRLLCQECLKSFEL